MSYKLIFRVIQGNLGDEEVIFEESGPCIIGRLEDCAFYIAPEQDPRISRHHCLLLLDPPNAVIRDLGSRNGTFVNDERLVPGVLGEDPFARSQADRVLRSGDIIRVGNTILEFSVDPPIVSKSFEKESKEQPRIKLKRPNEEDQEMSTKTPREQVTTSGGTRALTPQIPGNADQLAAMIKAGTLNKIVRETSTDLPPVSPKGKQDTVTQAVDAEEFKKVANENAQEPEQTGSSASKPVKAKLVSPGKKAPAEEAPAPKKVQSAKLVSSGKKAPAEEAPAPKKVQSAKLVSPGKKAPAEEAPSPKKVQSAKLVSPGKDVESDDQANKPNPSVDEEEVLEVEDSSVFNPMKIKIGKKKVPDRKVKVRIKKL